jgi:hypothetical protein
VKKRVALHGRPLIPEYLELSINLFTNTVLEQRHWKLDPDLCDKSQLPPSLIADFAKPAVSLLLRSRRWLFNASKKATYSVALNN